MFLLIYLIIPQLTKSWAAEDSLIFTITIPLTRQIYGLQQVLMPNDFSLQ